MQKLTEREVTGLTARFWSLVFPEHSAASQKIFSFLSLVHCIRTGSSVWTPEARSRLRGTVWRPLASAAPGSQSCPPRQPWLSSTACEGFIRAPRQSFQCSCFLFGQHTKGRKKANTLCLFPLCPAFWLLATQSRRALGYISTVVSANSFISCDLLARP